MEIDKQIIYIVVLVLSSLILLLVSVVIVYLRMVSRYLSLKETKDSLEERSEEISRLQSRKILEEANVRAREIVSNALNFKSDQTGKLEEEINKVAQMYADGYQEAVEGLKKSIVSVLTSVSDDIKKSAEKEISVFGGAFEETVKDAKVQLVSGINASFQGLNRQMETYRNHRIQQLDESVYKVVEAVSKKVLSKAITVQEHEKLVLKALEEAKKEFGLWDDTDNGN